MARGAKKRSGGGISLFPFLSVLACAMGVMIVIITGQNLLAVGETSDQYLEVAGPAQGKTPVYVECQEKAIVIHPERHEVSIETLQGVGPSTFHALLDQLKASADKKYLVLLVRPDGIDTYERCFHMAKYDRKLEVGKDALLAGGRVFLTEDGKPVLKKKTKGEK